VVVRSKIDSAGAFQLGCQFGEGESALEEAATEFVSAQISASRFGADRPDLVLVAGPDRGAAEEFTKQLEESGCGVVSARTGLECAARAQSLPMAAVVVHASLQDISALELARALRTSSWLQEVPILVYGPGLNADQCRQAGNADYLGERLSRQDASALLERLSR
jgi:CheY-like chemotaxis protein